MAERQRLRHGDVEGLRVGRFGGKVNTTCILWRIGDTLIDTGQSDPRLSRGGRGWLS